MNIPFTQYSTTQCRRLFNGKTVSPILPYSYKKEFLRGELTDANISLSVSGAQHKMPMVIDSGIIRYAEKGEQSTHILKPSPTRFSLNRDIPANEDLCMRIFRKVFRIPTAEACLCFFNDGVPAYLTRRFDISATGTKLHMEDFASLMNMEIHGGSHHKYEGSYEQLAEVIRKTSAIPALDLRRFYKIVLLNYLICNGDAHAKNFSMIEDEQGAFILSPAYDIMNTLTHVSDSPFAMKKGLFADGRPFDTRNAAAVFTDWAERIGVSPKIAISDIKQAKQHQSTVERMIAESFMSTKAQRVFLYHIRQRFNQFTISPQTVKL